MAAARKVIVQAPDGVDLRTVAASIRGSAKEQRIAISIGPPISPIEVRRSTASGSRMASAKHNTGLLIITNGLNGRAASVAGGASAVERAAAAIRLTAVDVLDGVGLTAIGKATTVTEVPVATYYTARRSTSLVSLARVAANCAS